MIADSAFRIHQFSLEGFGEHAGRELVDARARGKTRVELAGVGEVGFDGCDSSWGHSQLPRARALAEPGNVCPVPGMFSPRIWDAPYCLTPDAKSSISGYTAPIKITVR